MVRWVDVAALAKQHGIANANELAKRAGLSYPVARRFMLGETPAASERIDVDVLESLARLFNLKPWQLLDWGEWGSPSKKK